MSYDNISQPPDDNLPAKRTLMPLDGPVSIIEEKENVLARFPGLSAQRFSDAQKATLEQKIPGEEIDILPTGELYVSQVRYRRILNDAFGPGGWGLVPTGDFQQDAGTLCREYSLFAEGRFVASAIGEADFQPNNPRYSKATAAESLKSNALTRCCKDLLVASECWDKRFCREWIKKYAVAVWCVGKAKDIQGKEKKLWRRRDAERFEYPWAEKGPPPPPLPPAPPDDVPAVDLRADVTGGGIPTPAPATVEAQKPAESNSGASGGRKDYPFLREAKRQKERIGSSQYYALLGLAGYEHADEIPDRLTKKEVFKAWQAVPSLPQGEQGELGGGL